MSFDLEFTNKGSGSGDKTPSINISALRNAGVELPSNLAQGDQFIVRFHPKRGRKIRSIVLKVNRFDLSTAKATDWPKNMTQPKNGRPLIVSCTSVDFGDLI